jgi:adenylyltransferase/sulfurtransferase
VDDRLLERYSRHILIPEIDLDGQKRLLSSTAMLVGTGGLGSPVAMYLAASGVGHLILNDHDHVDLGNLQRQVVHTTHDLNRPKVDSARDRLHAINPNIRITTIGHQLSTHELMQYVHLTDVLIDASDNFTTRYALNAACVSAKTPLVWGAAIRFEGQTTTFINNHDKSPCLNCLYPYITDSVSGDTCDQIGVFAPLPGIIGSIMATEALKVILRVGATLCGRLLQINSATLHWRESRLLKDPSCEICHVQSIFNNDSKMNMQ